jgi:hypothetical protein
MDRPSEIPFGVCFAAPDKQKNKNRFNGVKISRDKFNWLYWLLFTVYDSP